MKSNYRPKAQIKFPNTWAVDSFLLRLKRSSGWKFSASSNATSIKVFPVHNEAVYILIGLLKSGSSIDVSINAEKLGDGGDAEWTKIYEYAGRYRC